MVLTWPPTSIWQERELVSEGMLLKEKLSWVPMVMVSVVVTVRASLAVTPNEQPEMNPPAIAKTSPGVNAISNAWGMGVPTPDIMLRMVW
jgi:hypothetical protein